MGMYQNFEPSGRKMATIGTECPRCNQPKMPAGKYIVIDIPLLPVDVKVFFFTIRLNIGISLKYCPGCGYLRVETVQ